MYRGLLAFQLIKSLRDFVQFPLKQKILQENINKKRAKIGFLKKA